MTRPRDVGAVALLGLAFAVAGLVASLASPPMVTLVCLGLATAYVTVAAVAARAEARGAAPLWLAAAPAVVTPAVTVLVGAALGTFAPSDPVLPLLAAGPFAAVALAYPFALSSDARERWTIVGLLAVATAPLLAVGVRGILFIEAEDGGLPVVFAAVMFVLLVPPTVPNYLLGRAVRQSVRGGDPPVRPLLVVAAAPFVVSLAALVTMPWLLAGTLVGPTVALLSVVALVAIGLAYRRVPA